MSISVNVDTTTWLKETKNNILKTENAVDHTVKKVAIRLKDRIEYYTPVGDPSLWHWPAHIGYTPGSLKQGWEISFDNREVLIKNVLPYALRVEFGWSTQAPEGMMRKACLEYPILVNRTANEFRL